MESYKKINVPSSARAELHDALNLTGAEVSINHMEAGSVVPFVHAHTENEEIYGIISGKGYIMLDGERIELNAGDWLRVDPTVKRQLAADANTDITYVCIQVKKDSLQHFTMSDAVLA